VNTSKFFLIFTALALLSGCAKQANSGVGNYLRTHTEIGNEWLEKKQYRNAVREYKNVLEFSAYYTPALIGLAQVNIEVGKEDEAISFLRSACDNDFYNKEPFLILAQFYMQLNMYDKADELMTEALTYSPLVPEYYITHGIVFEKMGLLSQAAHQYKKAIDINDELGVAYNNLANVLYQVKQYKLAKKYLDLAINNDFDVNPKMKESIEKAFIFYKKQKKINSETVKK